MTYFPDLSAYTGAFALGGCSVAVNVGWLDAGYPYTQGEPPDGLPERLARLARKPVNVMRGLHACGFCAEMVGEKDEGPEGHAFYRRLREVDALNSGEVVVAGSSGVCYHAPAMISHYVSCHGYLPPAEFSAAVLDAS